MATDMKPGAVIVARFGENAYQVIKDVKQRLFELEDGLPPGVKVIPTYDRSSLINRAVSTLQHTLIEGALPREIDGHFRYSEGWFRHFVERVFAAAEASIADLDVVVRETKRCREIGRRQEVRHDGRVHVAAEAVDRAAASQPSAGEQLRAVGFLIQSEVLADAHHRYVAIDLRDLPARSRADHAMRTEVHALTGQARAVGGDGDGGGGEADDGGVEDVDH